MLGSWQVFQVQDSFADLAEAAELSYKVDVVITDPPYPEKVQSNMCSGSLVGTKNVPKYELSFAALDANRARFVRAVTQVTRRWAVVFCALEDFGRFQDTVPENYVRSGVWYKPNAMGQLTADRPATAYEGLGIMHAAGVKKFWNGRGSYGIWTCNGTRGKKDRHPNEKPINLCLKLVALFSQRGETILDPFCGSGAIGEAAIRLGRDYVGWDNDPAWVAAAGARLSGPLESVTDDAALALCGMKCGEGAST